MTPTEAFGWTCIYLGMLVGVITWVVVVAATFYDLKNKDKK